MDVGSVGGVAGAGVAVGTAMNMPSAGAAPAASIGGTGASPASTHFVVTISDAAVQALRWDVATAIAGSSTSRLAEDLAALALLAILEQRNRQNDTSVNVAAAIGAYLAIQALS